MAEATQTVDILDFVDLAEISPLYFDKAGQLEASPEPAPRPERAAKRKSA